MVFKISKGGVRTGNTLRGLHSAKTRRYGRHACLLGTTSLGRRDLRRLVGENEDEDEADQMVMETLSKTNVLLSLNKHQRWRLPAMIGHMIKRGDFNKGALVSLLERHKLKRRANCVKLVSNSKKTESIAPGQKKYFSFNLDSFGEEESNRKKKKTRSEENSNSSHGPITKRDGNYFRTVETYTSERNRQLEEGSLHSNKPEYRFEVFYPCPQSCSLTYNPKYTDVTIVEGKNGNMEVKSIVKKKNKGGTKHRNRLLLKYIDRLYSEAIQDDVDEMWDDNEECLEGDDNISNEEVLKPSDRFTIDHSIIDMLLGQAQRTRDLCTNKTDILHQKRSKCQHFGNTKDRSHIVFVDREVDQNSQVDTHDSSFISSYNTTEGKTSGLKFVKVILPVSEVAPEELRRVYGNRYAEASSLPRRFVIDATNDITNLLATSKASTQEQDFSSYLVCIHDGFYDDGLAVYKIALNSMTEQSMTDALPFAPNSIPEIMNALVGHLLDVKEKHCISFVETKATYKAKINDNFVNSRIKLKVEVVNRGNLPTKVLSDETTDVSSTSGTLSQQLQSQCGVDMDEEVFCDVCYASVTSSKIDSADGTQMRQCQHLLCNECWATHFRTNMKNGKTVLTCGGYDCNTEIGIVTLLSILNVSEINLLLQRQAEEALDKMDNARYCPYPECGRVIIVEAHSEDLCVDVMCACGNKICFSCFGPAHWPAKCGQAEEYNEILPDIKPTINDDKDEESTAIPGPPVVANSKEPKTMTMEGRICPRCAKFIYKDGGCRHLVCKCGFVMCWNCVKAYHTFGACKLDPSWLFKHSRVVVVKHTAIKRIVPLDSKEAKTELTLQKTRPKTSLYQRALQQRQESWKSGKCTTKGMMMPLVSKIAKAARHDLCFKQKIAASLLVDLSDIGDEALQKLELSPCINEFIKKAANMKQQLHHVTEYTFILLQGAPNNVARQRLFKLTNDLTGFCSFVRSILEVGDKQDAKEAFTRLVSLQEWAKRALDALIVTSQRLREEIVR